MGTTRALARSPEGIVKSPAPAPKGYFVDRFSADGRCDDSRQARVARSRAKPWCSVTRAVAAAPARSTVYLRAGKYPQVDLSGLRRRGGVTVRSYPGERVVVRGVVAQAGVPLRIEGLTITAPILVGPNASDVRIVNNRLTPAGITLQEGSRNIRIEGNYITNPTGAGVHFSGARDAAPISSVAIIGNHFDKIGATAINARFFLNLLIEANEITGVHSHDGIVHPNAIRTFGGGNGLYVLRNFIHDNKKGALCFFIKDGRVSNVLLQNNLIVRNDALGFSVYDVDNITLANNTIINNSGGAIFRGNATNAVLKNNILGSLHIEDATKTKLAYEDYNYLQSARSIPGGPHDLKTGLKFVNPTALDYRLAPTSTGIDAGTSEDAPLLDWLELGRIDDPGVANRGGGLFPYYDLGMHEYGSRVAAPDPHTDPGPVSAPGPVRAPAQPAAPAYVPAPIVGPGILPRPRPARPPGAKSRWLLIATDGRRARLQSIRRGVLVAVDCSRACSVQASATVRTGRRRVQSRSLRTRVGRGRQKVIRIHFARGAHRKVARQLARYGEAKVGIRVRAADPTGTRLVASRVLRLR